jgi:hypothetical protein
MTLQGRNRRLLCALMMFVSAAIAPARADAGPSRLGGTIDASGMIGSMVTDIAQDPVNDVYLTVSGQLTDNRRIYGRFVHGDGTVLRGAVFYISSGYAQQPRVAYSAALGGFLTIWIDLAGQVKGRFVRFSPGGEPVFATGEFVIATPVGGAPSETPPAAACAGVKRECLVAWRQVGIQRTPTEHDIHAVRINLDGQRVSDTYVLTNDPVWQTDPAIGYDPATGIYLLAHTQFTNSTQLWVHRIEAESGARLGAAVLADEPLIHRPELALNSRTGEFLVSFYELRRQIVYGRFMKSDGAITSNLKPFVSGYAGHDSNDVAYNANSNSFFAVVNGLGHEVVGYEIFSDGTPSRDFHVTDIRGPEGTFYPRIAGHSGRSEWMMSASAYFTFTAGQRVTTDTQGPGTPPPPPPSGENEPIDLSPTGAPNGSWFLAEGNAHDKGADPNGFVTFYLIVNENPEPVTVRAYFSSETGKTFSRTFTVAANSRISPNLANVAGLGTFGAVFQSLTPGLDIFVERSIYWGPDLEGSTAEVATKALAFEWNFGEGSRPFFSNYFLLFNPNQVGGSATFTFFLESGGTVQREVPFGPQQRVTLDASTVPELDMQNFGVKISSSVPIVAERAMYFDYAAPRGFIGGTASIGAPGLSQAWLFAEGAAAPGFDTFYLLMNPNPFPITVNRWFFQEDGTRYEGSYTVDAGSRKTVYLNEDMGNFGGAAAQFTSASPFIAERSIYWGANGWVEGTNTIGSPVTAAEWHLPEGTEGGGFDTFLLLFNPGTTTVTTDVVLYIEGWGRFTAPPNLRPVLAPQTRTTINMRDFLAEMEKAAGLAPDTLTETSFSTVVRSTTGDGIVVEHALYRTRDGDNRWRTGGASFGVPR